MEYVKREEQVKNEETNEMENVEFIAQDDGKEYLIVDEIESQRGHYVYLVSVNDEKDICVKKIIEDKIYPLDDEKEFEYTMYIFAKKNKEKIEDLLKEEGQN